MGGSSGQSNGWLLYLARPMLLVALLFVGWLALLGFPWPWAIPLELLAMLVVLGMEYSARDVGGASGWMTFAYLLGHTWLFGGALLLRLLLWAWHRLVM